MNRLKEVRKSKKMTQTQLASLVNVSQRHIAFLENGDRLPSLEVAIKISEVLEETVNYIFLINKCTNSTGEGEDKETA